MFARLFRWAREGSIVTLTAVALAGAPATALADDGDGFFDKAKFLVQGLGAVFNPSHDIGKFALGSVMVGGGMAGIAAGEMAVAAGAAALVGTAITAGAAVAIVAGVGLAVWGGYRLWKSFNDDGNSGRPAPIDPSRPAPGGPMPGDPGRIDPGPITPGSPGVPTPGAPGPVETGGGSNTPGDNGPRIRLPVPPRRSSAPTTAPSNVGEAAPAGFLRP